MILHSELLYKIFEYNHLICKSNYDYDAYLLICETFHIDKILDLPKPLASKLIDLFGSLISSNLVLNKEDLQKKLNEINHDYYLETVNIYKNLVDKYSNVNLKIDTAEKWHEIDSKAESILKDLNSLPNDEIYQTIKSIIRLIDTYCDKQTRNFILSQFVDSINAIKAHPYAVLRNLSLALISKEFEVSYKAKRGVKDDT